MQAFTLDSSSGIPVKLQLKAHMRYQIMAGLLRPGDQLPPLRDLAAGLGVHLNTVVRAVADLEAEGFVYSHQGRGVFVADEFPGQGHGAALRSLMAGVLQPAREWGMTPEDMALALLAHGQLARPPRETPHRLLLVAGTRPHLKRLQSELEAALPVLVDAVLPEDLPEKLRTADFPMGVATLYHVSELKRLLPKATVVTLAGTAARESFAALSRLEHGAEVAVASRDWVHAARVRRSLEQSGLPLSLEIAVGATPAALAPKLLTARFVVATADCRELVREALVGHPEVPWVAEPVEAPPDALQALREALGNPAGEHRVHVRSAWV